MYDTGRKIIIENIMLKVMNITTSWLNIQLVENDIWKDSSY